MMREKKQEKRKYSVPAVENAFAILRLLSRKRFKESTLTEIANALSLSPATCFRILQYLEESAIVRYEKDKKRYTLGPYLVVLGERAKEHLDYLSIVKPYLESLTKETGLTSVLVNRVGKEKLTFVLKVEGEDYGVHVSIGRHFSIIDGSYGMCFLAYMDKEERDGYLKSEVGVKSDNQPYNQLLEEDFEKVRQDGYYITYGEFIKGIFGIAAPIFNGANQVEMAIALVGSIAQFEKSELLEKGIVTKNVANEITRTITNF